MAGLVKLYALPDSRDVPRACPRGSIFLGQWKSH